MSNPILYKFREIKPISDINAANGMLQTLVDMTPKEQERFWSRCNKTGHVCMYATEDFPGKVLEYVQGSQQDSVTTLYDSTQGTKCLYDIAKTRKELIDEIGVVLMAPSNTVAVFDYGRNRQAMLYELGTAQLMDVLAHFTHTDIGSL